jgi:hypothetical protein
MPINENGFLGKEIKEWIDKHRSDNEEWFNLCLDLNRYCHYILDKISFKSKNEQKFIAASLYMRILSFYQSSIILSERGLFNESMIILRSMVEAMFILCAVVKNEEIVEEYKSESSKRKRITQENIMKNSAGIFEEILTSKEIKGKLLNSLKKLKIFRKSSDNKNKTKSNYDFMKHCAKEAGLKEFYPYYMVYNPIVHSGYFELNQYLQTNSNGITEARWGPSVKGINCLLFTAFVLMLNTLRSTHKLFSLSEEKIDELEKRFKHLTPKVSEDVGFCEQSL